jgi:hypothetical protein
MCSKCYTPTGAHIVAVTNATKHAVAQIMAKASYSAIDFGHALGTVDIQCAFDNYMQEVPTYLASVLDRQGIDFAVEVRAAIKTLGFTL